MSREVEKSQEDARASVVAIFEKLSKKNRQEYIGEYNEALLYISGHPHTESQTNDEPEALDDDACEGRR
jgi:hypothetical protein